MSISKTIDIMRSKLNERKRNRCIDEINALKMFETRKNITGSDFKLKVENYIIDYLNDPLIDLPMNSNQLLLKLSIEYETDEVNEQIVNQILFKLAFDYKIIKIEEKNMNESDDDYLEINEIDLEKLDGYCRKILKRKSPEESDNQTNTFETKKNLKTDENESLNKEKALVKTYKSLSTQEHIANIQNLLDKPSISEIESKNLTNKLFNLINATTTMEKLELERFKSQKTHVQEYCPYGTRDECLKNLFQKKIPFKKCEKVHFKRIIKPHTDVTLGDCSFLNTCYNMNNCKYIHYEVDMNDVKQDLLLNSNALISKISTRKIPPQWIQCDLRTLDMRVLGKFAVIMADPPWDIHMELPYGTMADEEMKKLDIPSLQDDGYIFLWVTGRAMELGRECLKEWKYERVDELIWVKTNQLQRIIRTGRTGHWLNHGKEHCLIGVKGNPDPKLFNKGIDCDIIVAEVRATSHKPDEVYGIIERLSPGTRKVELFGRPHNVQPNWITLGNQLDGVRLVEPEVVKKFKERYKDGNAMPSIPSNNPTTSSANSASNTINTNNLQNVAITQSNNGTNNNA